MIADAAMGKTVCNRIVICQVDISEIREAYANYIIYGDEFYFEDLIRLTDAMCRNWVKAHLRSKGCYDDETMDDAMCGAQIGLWTTAKAVKFPYSVEAEELSRYCFGIYKNSAKRVVRRYYSNKNMISRNSISLDQYLEKGIEVQYANQVGFFPMNSDVLYKHYHHDGMDDDKDEERQVYARLLEEYIYTLLNSYVAPQKALALMYARILPHMLEAISETKMTSVKYARVKMSKKTVEECKDLAERILKALSFSVSDFGEGFMTQLDESCSNDEKRLLVRDLEYTKMYTADKIEHWDADFHRIIQRDTRKRLKRDQEFVETARRFVRDTRKYSSLFNGG